MTELMPYDAFRAEISGFLAHEGCPLSPPLPLAHPKIETNFMMSLAVTLLPQDSMDGVRRGGNDYGVIQPCIRVHDKDQVWQDAVPWHLTFFEMAGAVVGGTDSRRRALGILLRLLTGPIGLRIKDLRFMSFAGKALPGLDADGETVAVLRSMGVSDDQITASEDCFFGLREDERVAGPSLEVAWADADGTERELATAVFLDLAIEPGGGMRPLSMPVAEVGLGVERAYCATLRRGDLTQSEPLQSVMAAAALKDKQAALIVADRMRAVVHAVGCGVLPRGRGRGYELRKLIRDAFRAVGGDSPTQKLFQAASRVVEQYRPHYPSLDADRVHETIKTEFRHEEDRQTI